MLLGLCVEWKKPNCVLLFYLSRHSLPGWCAIEWRATLTAFFFLLLLPATSFIAAHKSIESRQMGKRWLDAKKKKKEFSFFAFPPKLPLLRHGRARATLIARRIFFFISRWHSNKPFVSAVSARRETRTRERVRESGEQYDPAGGNLLLLHT